LHAGVRLSMEVMRAHDRSGMVDTMKRWTGLISGALALLLAMTLVAGASAQGATPTGGEAGDLERATLWLMSQQTPDGGFAGLDGTPDPSITVDAIIALVAAGQWGVNTDLAVDSAMAWLASGDQTLVFAQTGQGQAAKLVLAAVASGADPRDIGGVDPLAMIEAGLDAETGFYGRGVFDHALCLLALAATGTDLPDEAITVLDSTRTPEGGWAFDGTATEGAADSNTTALVVQALVALGQADSPLVADAMAYLLTAVDGTSGATFQPGAGFPADSSSTAMVMQAVIAVGDDPASDAWGNLPAALATYQNASGAFHYSPDDPSDNIFATVQVIPALAGMTMPVTLGAPIATPVALWIDGPRMLAA
jgi:hypothetical protein